MLTKLAGAFDAAKAALQLGVVVVACTVVPQLAQAAPTYLFNFTDAVTGDNNSYVDQTNDIRRWDVDPGADSYTQDFYERPQDNNFKYDPVTGRYGTTKYYQNLDIVGAKYGYDDKFIYAQISLFGLGFEIDDGSGGIKVDTGDGLAYNYGLRIATNPDGSGGYFFRVLDPKGNSTGVLGTKGTEGFRDTNGDVGGPGGRLVYDEGGGNGFETEISKEDAKILVRRDGAMIEFQIDYHAFGLTLGDLTVLKYLEFEANKGLQDRANYLWNDKYDPIAGGSPYWGGSGDLNEFGSVGTAGNIYELDTLTAHTDITIPEPANIALLGLGLVGFGLLRRRSITRA